MEVGGTNKDDHAMYPLFNLQIDQNNCLIFNFIYPKKKKKLFFTTQQASQFNTQKNACFRHFEFENQFSHN